MSVKILLSASALCLLIGAFSAAEPPTCRVIWIFDLPCVDPVNALVNQAKAWIEKKCYDGQGKCKYEIVKQSATFIEIKHTALKTNVTTDLTFDFKPPTAPSFCRMSGLSTRKPVKGDSPNDYCLLFNLVDGSGLTKAKGYREICNEAMCPPLKSATCHKQRWAV